jgi:hypothetical protein
MNGLETASRPSTLGILRKYYTSVLHLVDYIKENHSQNRFAKVLCVAEEHEGMKKLIETAYVCTTASLFEDDDDGLDDQSILATGENASQIEVGPV